MKMEMRAVYRRKKTEVSWQKSVLPTIFCSVYHVAYGNLTSPPPHYRACACSDASAESDTGDGVLPCHCNTSHPFLSLEGEAEEREESGGGGGKNSEGSPGSGSGTTAGREIKGSIQVMVYRMWNVVCREPHIRYTTYHIQSIYEPIGVIRTFLAVDFSILSLSSSAKILCLLCFVSSVLVSVFPFLYPPTLSRITLPSSKRMTRVWRESTISTSCVARITVVPCL